MSSAAHAFDLQGHRGARGLAPENTLPGFARALAIGVTTLELDCAITRDGVVVISHDPRLNPDITRDADGRWLASTGPAIASLTFAELQAYDVGRIKPGTAYAARFPKQTGADGVRIPRLADLFALVAGSGGSGGSAVRFNIETKISPETPELTVGPEAFARAIVRVIRDAGLAARTTIQSFDWRTLVLVQREAPEITTAYLSAQDPGFDTIRARTGETSPWTAGVDYASAGSVPRMVHRSGGRIWSPAFNSITPALVAEAHTLGIKVIPWTVNVRADIERVIGLGVDGIISDHPEIVREVMTARKMPLPPPASGRQVR